MQAANRGRGKTGPTMDFIHLPWSSGHAVKDPRSSALQLLLAFRRSNDEVDVFIRDAARHCSSAGAVAIETPMSGVIRRKKASLA
jgi:hypothetical protein